MTKWIGLIEGDIRKKVCFIIGNKEDLMTEHDRKSLSKIRDLWECQYRKFMGLEHIICSAKDNDNIGIIFTKIIEIIIER